MSDLNNILARLALVLVVAALAYLTSACRHPGWAGEPEGDEDRFADCAGVLLENDCCLPTFNERSVCMMRLAGEYRSSRDRPEWLRGHGCPDE